MYQPAGGEKQILAPGSFLLTAYAAQSGEKIWWVRGLSFELEATTVGKRSGYDDGSSTICVKITARAAASGRRARQRCSVLGCPFCKDFGIERYEEMEGVGDWGGPGERLVRMVAVKS